MTEQTSYSPPARGRAVAPHPQRLEGTFPLAPLQEGMLFHSVAAPRPGVDFQQFVCNVAPGFDIEAFRHAWRGVIDRHAILRTSFHWKDVPEPIQRVHRRAVLPIELLDWSAVPAADVPERRRRFLLADRRRGFDVTRAPCMRLAIIRLPDDRHTIVWSFHHLLLDGRSFFTVLTDLFATYEALRDGSVVRLPQARPFGDYLEWLRDRDDAAAEAFWKRELEGARPTPLVVTRSVMRTLRPDEEPSGRYEERLSRETSDRIRQAAARAGVTVNTLVQTAWAIVLHRYGGTGDVVFGATRSGRHSTVPGAESMVGMTINTLPVRARIAPEEPVAAVAQRLRQLWVDMRPHEHTTLTRVMEAASIRPDAPLFDSIIVAENYDWKTDLRSRVGDWLESDFEIIEWTNYAVTVVADLGPELILALEYDRRRFDDDVPERVLGHLRTVMESFADGLERPVREVPMLPEVERRRVLEEWNDTAAPWDRDACIHHVLERAVAERPGAPAVSAGGRTLSFAELDARANRLANELRRLGVGPDVAVGICLKRGFDLAIGLLGILKAGGAYVPLDPDYPEDRLRFMVEQSGVQVVVTEAFLADRIPDGGFTRLCMNTDADRIERAEAAPPEPRVGPRHAACIIYTSGSTGQPKGVVLTHGSIVNHATHMIRVLGLGPEDRVPQSASMSFDLAILELYATWMVGATVVMRPDGVLSSSRLGPWLEREQITVLHLPTALWHQWVHDLSGSGGTLPPRLRVVLVGGEKASTEAVNAWARLGDGRVRWINIYGPTECTVNATVYEPRFADGHTIGGEIPIGKPISNVRVYVLDDRMEPAPIGVPGEVYIAGEGVSRGYLSSPEQTTRKFVPDPFADREDARMYRTGDLARWRHDGNLEFVARVDHQVKIRGFRVECGEVETILERHPALRQVVVHALDDRTGGKRLVAYVVPAEPTGPTSDELRQYLRSALPEFMIPSAFVLLDELPCSPNGKVDRNRLPSPEERPVARSAEYVPPRNPVEETLTEVFERVLGRPRVGIHDSFFDLGGHSLLALRILDEIGRAGLSLTVEQLFQRPTAAELAQVVSFQAVEEGGWSCLVTLRGGRGRPPVYMMHTTPGDVLGYTDLVRELGADQPCYGLQSVGLHDPSCAHRSIEEMASHYLDALRRHQPEGPYHLVGWCYGGVVAYEMAQQLVAQGQRVGLLGLIDSPAPHPGLWNVGYWLDRFRAIRSLSATELFTWGRTRAQGWLESHQKRNTEALAVQVSKGPLANRAAVSEVNLGAIRRYRPQFYPGRLTLFRRTEPVPGTAHDPWLGWRNLVGQLEVRPIAASTHQSILRLPHVRALAEAIRNRVG